METKVLTVFLVRDGVAVAKLDIVVLPARQFVGLSLRKPSSTCCVEEGSSNETASDQINSVVMAQVHGSPPDPAGIDDEEVAELGESVAHEEGLENCVGSVQRWEGTKGQGCILEVGCVEINAKDGVDAGETSRRATHTIGGGNQAIFVLIPGWRAGEHELNGDTEDAHPAKGARKDVDSARSGKDEEDEGADGRGGKVDDAIREPGENVENRMLVGGQDVGQIGAVQDIFEGWEDANPDMGAILVLDEPGTRVLGG